VSLPLVSVDALKRQPAWFFGETLVAIDRRKFKAVNHRDRNVTSAELKRWMEAIEASIARLRSTFLSPH
jgi:hypothetical protein